MHHLGMRWGLVARLVALISLASLVAACTSATGPAPTTAPAKPVTAPTVAPPAAAPTTAAAAATAAPAAPAATVAPAAAAPIVMKFASWVGPDTAFGKGMSWYLDEVEKRTQGRVKFERYWTEQLAPAKGILQAVNTGIADVVSISPGYNPAETPLFSLGTVPGIMEGNIWPSYRAFLDLYRGEVKGMTDEFAKNNIRMLSPAGGTPQGLLSRKQTASMADFKGQKVRAVAEVATLVGALGGVPVNMAATDVYTAIQRGTIDGVAYNPAGATAYRVQEVAKYFWTMPLGGSIFAMVIRIPTWNKLSPDIQKIMDDTALDHITAYQKIYQADGDGAALETMKKAGVVVTEVAAAEKAKAAELTKAASWDPWVKDMASKGLPGQQAFDTWLKLIDKYKPLTPK